MLKRPISNCIQLHKLLYTNNQFINFLHRDYMYSMNTQKQKVKGRQNPFSNGEMGKKVYLLNSSGLNKKN